MTKVLPKKFVTVLFFLIFFFSSGKFAVSQGNGVQFYFEKNDYQVNSGEVIEVNVKANSGRKRIDLALLELNFSSGLEVQDVILADLPDELGVSTGDGKISVKAVKMSNWQSLPNNKFDIATIKVKTNSEGKISFNNAQANECIPSGDNCQVAGFEVETGEDANIEVGLSGQGLTNKILKWFLSILGL